MRFKKIKNNDCVLDCEIEYCHNPALYFNHKHRFHVCLFHKKYKGAI